jgi:hypothetical protein
MVGVLTHVTKHHVNSQNQTANNIVCAFCIHFNVSIKQHNRHSLMMTIKKIQWDYILLTANRNPTIQLQTSIMECKTWCWMLTLRNVLAYPSWGMNIHDPQKFHLLHNDLSTNSQSPMSTSSTEWTYMIWTQTTFHLYFWSRITYQIRNETQGSHELKTAEITL